MNSFISVAPKFDTLEVCLVVLEWKNRRGRGQYELEVNLDAEEVGSFYCDSDGYTKICNQV
jgi:hypothetical protein